jgi:hypothetical protein
MYQTLLLLLLPRFNASPINWNTPLASLLLSTSTPANSFTIPLATSPLIHQNTLLAAPAPSLYTTPWDEELPQAEKESIETFSLLFPSPDKFAWESEAPPLEIEKLFDLHDIDSSVHLIPVLREWYKRHKGFFDLPCRVNKDEKTMLDFYLQSTSLEDGPGGYTWFFGMGPLQEFRLVAYEQKVLAELGVFGVALFHGGGGWLDAFRNIGNEDLDLIRGDEKN